MNFVVNTLNIFYFNNFATFEISEDDLKNECLDLNLKNGKGAENGC